MNSTFDFWKGAPMKKLLSLLLTAALLLGLAVPAFAENDPAYAAAIEA